MICEPAIDPDEHPGTPEYQELAERREAIRQAMLDALMEEKELHDCLRPHS